MASRAQENRFVTWTDWNGYGRFLEAVGEGRTRITYDQGVLELLSPSPEHERVRILLRALIECYLEERDIDFLGAGSMTFRWEDLHRGLEPDECYWIGELGLVLGMSHFEPAVHRPPDLALEVDITSSCLDRMGIYAALGVPEVWRYLPAQRSKSGQHGITVYRLDSATFRPAEASRVLPGMDFDVLLCHLDLGRSAGQNKMIRSFRAWARPYSAGH